MPDPADLFAIEGDLADVPRGLHLVAGLTGFADAGGAVGQLAEHLHGTLEHRTVVEFDPDQLLDYRARRPIITFDQDHLTDYTPASLRLSLAHDELHQPFLLLTGFEPDYQWERFTRAVLELIDRLEVASTTWVHAIPMPVPHTRPVGVTVSGNREDLIEAMSVWKPVTQVPANVLHLLELRLYDRALPAVGFALLIPHYLSDTAYPQAAVAALESISASTGLIFPTDSLRESGREFLSKVDEQVGSNEELQKLVAALESRHDTYMEGTSLRSPLTDEDGFVPTADALAAELEKFLAIKRPGEEPTAQ
ncbi:MULTISPECIES: proteasome assembly chaperone family protein [unclassified Rathayibacter]|uniref:proteasome assembly chaperone family protein n=1 Tax=unclassified Rathayibacter TaxID=2609250 RepID=UPI000F4C58CD|nr:MULTISPECIES: PAC2 family protein [unclassified Rathayibacter]MCJ1673309.1 PAC2 family protein [Rathayibacter sp. VKM Ac-2929]MCJ1682942.1 PAC2 family protein [Rathayibacter sp. VKM Ac-2928]MCJ1687688.1 PAC2 family protein [Rathayibacter sp. VKM Ac-2927]MCJ1703985.1 PAC2 family protein [Rathayibacter sp. VKM Ac-2926]ROP48394.1 PAC2 family protein [Rathayibacter sp. PhB186]